MIEKATTRKVAIAVLFIIISQAAGGIGSIFTASGLGSWYQQLNKPDFNPPGWVFGPVWITLYTMMGIAAALVWFKGIHRPIVKLAMVAFAIQLVLNAAWSGLFFGLQSPGLGLIGIILLWMFIVDTTFLFFFVSRTAGFMMLPYLAWVTFAAVLNFAIYRLNA